MAGVARARRRRLRRFQAALRSALSHSPERLPLHLERRTNVATLSQDTPQALAPPCLPPSFEPGTPEPRACVDLQAKQRAPPVPDATHESPAIATYLCVGRRSAGRQRCPSASRDGARTPLRLRFGERLLTTLNRFTCLAPGTRGRHGVKQGNSASIVRGIWAQAALELPL